MSGIKTKHIVIHIIDPDGEDHYPRFNTMTGAEKYLDAMRKLKIHAEIVFSL